eukprot:1924531-Rhodomonas_salina.2
MAGGATQCTRFAVLRSRIWFAVSLPTLLSKLASGGDMLKGDFLSQTLRSFLFACCKPLARCGARY